jgi:hypothetical protein
MNQLSRYTSILAGVALAASTFTGTALAQVRPSRSAVAPKAMSHPDLRGQDFYQDARTLPRKAAGDVWQRLEQLGATDSTAVLDLRTGRFATLTPSTPLIPGTGVNNYLSWQKAATAEKPGQAAWAALRSYLRQHEGSLQVDVDDLSEAPTITVLEDGNTIHVHAPRQIDGVRVLDSYVKGTVRFGNLILLGAHKWNDRGASGHDFRIDAKDAEVIADDALGNVIGNWGKTEPVFVTLYNGNAPGHSQGYRYQAAYAVKRNVREDAGNWRVLVNAKTGDLLQVEDRNAYAEIKGGVLPVTNDGIVPDGVEQASWPMPYADTAQGTTDTGGNIAAGGSVTVDFYGPYVDISDNCGSSSLTGTDTLDWGTSSGTDCTTPGFGGAGNTHASRTCFYELNKIIEMGRGQLPSNSWLQQRLTSNMNIDNSCNAYWNGTVNFYRSGGGCFNTGEIAGVFDHEWGHGMDANDATPGIASPSGEGVADIYTALRLNDSCIGRNFQGSVCSGNGDACLTCTGVRDIDYAKRSSGNPHTFTWSDSNCSGSVHCVGGVYSEAVWSLWKRKLQSAPYNYDNNTAHEIVTRLTYIGAGATGTWFSGSAPNGGCAATNGYQNYLAADDDNGDLNDGTPHMQAIYDAFNDQEIACATPTVQDSGCSGVPTAAPNVTASVSDKAVDLSWGAVSGAVKYQVFRTEGVFACDFGKVKLGETTSTSWTDSGLQNSRQYSYVVLGVGSSNACMGPASSCVNASPVSGPSLSIDSGSASLVISGGDSDDYLDNCETAAMTFTVNNIGAGSLTNVRVTAITPSNGGVTIDSALPLSTSPSTIVQGGSATGSFAFTAGGLAAGETLTFTVTVESNETAPKNGGLSEASAETDLTFTASTTYDFDVDASGWVVGQGTFGRSSGYEASSTGLDNQCDQVTSPTVVFSASTTLTLSSNYDIEPVYTNSQWYDRANIGLNTGGNRSAVSPDSGRAYDASGVNGSCGTSGQNGWAGANASWASSAFSASALGSSGLAGQEVQLDVRYGTDASLNGAGFWFDDVTLTDVYIQGTDAQDDVCGGAVCTLDADCDNGAWCDGAETCNAGTCVNGSAPNCDDGVSCTNDSCNEGTDSCDNTVDDANCDNGAWCDGAETCSATLNCQAGTAPNCDDGVGCTADACNEGTDACDNTPDDGVCDNGAWCDGGETCDVALDCQAGTAPSCANGCDETGDVCFECSVDADCNDGIFCNGSESCAAGSCAAGSDPCPGQSCDETGDVCTNSNGPQDAVYDAVLGAPQCVLAGSECDSLTLLDGRGTVGPEPNASNTLDSCSDGNSGGYHSDESNDRIVVKTLDGSDLSEGATAQIEATVYAYSSGGSDTLDLYSAADATNPMWTLIGSYTSAGGVQTITAQYTLPVGSLQAVRANYRYNGSQSSCSGGTYDDADDLVFAVGGGAPECTVDADCDDALFCNGTETCNAGSCSAGSDPCTGQSCDEAGDVCVPSGGDQTAVYDATLGAPQCASVGKSCDAGAALLDSRGTLGAGEPNASNTLDGCADGDSGVYHFDESLDAMKVYTNDGGDFAASKTVTIEATVYAYSSGSTDTLDLYGAADASNPTWVLIGSIAPAAGGVQTLTTTYTLPSGSLQAVRGAFRFSGSEGACTSGSYNDRDDVVFAVN